MGTVSLIVFYTLRINNYTIDYSNVVAVVIILVFELIIILSRNNGGWN